MNTYWHLTNTGFSMLLHNARVGKGWVLSVDRMAEGMPEATTPYAHLNSQPDKEAVWENVRQQIGPEKLPTRLKCFYAFLSIEDAKMAHAKWGMEERTLVEVRPASDARVHVADATLLNALPESWATNAASYWRGECTPEPLMEVLISGALYFPGWEHPPFPDLPR